MLKSIKNFKKRRKDCKKKQRKKFKKRGGREGAYSEIIRNVVKFFLGFLCKPKASSFYASNFNQSFLHFQFSLSLSLKLREEEAPPEMKFLSVGKPAFKNCEILVGWLSSGFEHLY